MSKPLALALLLVATAALAAPPRPYHIELEANPAAAFPFLSKFGKVTLHVYPGGVRAETFWLNGFSRNGSPSVTVENPLGRMYTDVPIEQISSILRKMAHGTVESTPSPSKPMAGKVRGVVAKRYRLLYGPEAWIDVWTTTSVPETPQLRAIVEQFVSGISPGTASALRSVPGTPLYVELNFSHYRKLPLLRMKNFSMTNAGEDDALKTGTLYFKAPMLDSIWK